VSLTARRGLLIAFASYTVVTVALFPGLVLRIGTVLPHDLGDPVLSTWILWWNAHHLPFTAAWWDGMFFFPMHGALALSDHRVGLAPISSTVQWLGGSPVLAHNVTFLLTFPLCAIAAHALAWRVTRSYSAAFIAGLIFGFNPYRMSHLPHLALLAVYWLPVAMLALHEYVESGRTAWLAAFVAALVLQGVTSGYYLMYAAPLIAGWTIWFAHGRPTRIAGVAIGCALAAAAMSPILLAYRDIQNQLDLTRSLQAIETFSADITALVTAWPLMAVWHTPEWLRRPEGELFPGAIAIALLVAGMLQRGDPAPAPRRRLVVVRTILACVAVAFAIAGLRAAIAPGTIHVFGISISSVRADRPIAIASLAIGLLGVTSAAFRRAFARRSAFAFYAIATFALWLFALGPFPRFLGDQVLATGPYAFLMALPGYSDRLRVPARFAMIAVLTLSVAAALAVARVAATANRRRYVGMVAILCAAILVDSWIVGLPLPEAPAPRPLGPLGNNASRVAAVLELPIGGDVREVEAFYQSRFHGRPVVNGYSGYDPHHYQVLRMALDRGDDSVFDTLATHGPLLVRVDTTADGNDVAARLARRPGAMRVADPAAGVSAFLLPAATADPPSVGVRLPVRAITISVGQFLARYVIDGDPLTRWVAPQRGEEEFVIELDAVHRVSALALAMGPFSSDYPRALATATSLDGAAWTDGWRGRCGGRALRAVLDHPRLATLQLPLAGMARFVRVRQLERDDVYAWSVSEIAVLGE